MGRFVVLDTLGLGGMGVVVSAYDPKLDRKVALKLLRPDVAPCEGSTPSRGRLLREARAMAKLRHPSVVTVFEVGEVDKQVFLAMEYVPGSTLTQWCGIRRAETDGWERIVAAFAEAGRGLEAAHAQGLIHRDFKPANVLIDGDRVQVTDFGIASVEGRELVPDLQPWPVDAVGPDAPTLTSAGALVGTAPYMAPELIAGDPADEKSDQFAFCVALFECLYGHRPFVGDTTAAVAHAITEGEIKDPERTFGVPHWVRKALTRGLSPDPNDRWPSMADLVDTLSSPETAEVGRRMRITVARIAGVAFIANPFIAMVIGPPFDRSTYGGVVIQTLILLVMLSLIGWAYRLLIRATVINRRTFGALFAVVAMHLPLELGGWALGVPILASDIMHAALWCAMTTMYGVAVDRRFFVLAAVYLVAFVISIAFEAYYLLVLGGANAAFIAFMSVIWRHDAVPMRGGVTSSSRVTPAR